MICLELPTRDHPRVCGEHSSASGIPCRGWGSSPRVRGTRGHARCFEGRAGIIPACAGNTCKVSSSVFSAWDHPRVCGEHKMKLNFDSKDGGIIPACAGNTMSVCAANIRTGDHPRVCGEHVSGLVPFEDHAGSSPRVRGTQAQASAAHCTTGIIPACAGNTCPG